MMIKSKIHPPKKASEVLIDFAKPLLDVVPKSSSIEELDKLLTLPIGIWNIHSLKFWESSKVDHRKNYLDRIGESQNPDLKAVFDFWENRRLSLYPNELWCFDYKVVRDLKDPS